MRKKGFSGVITVIILIGLVLSSISIIWVVIQNVLTGKTEDISVGLSEVDLKISNVLIEGNEINVTIIRGVGEGDLVGIKFVFDSDNGNEVIPLPVEMNQLSKEIFNFTLPNIYGNVVVSIIPIINQSGKTYDLPSSGTEVVNKDCIPDGDTSCAANTCIGSTCSSNCGTPIDGTKSLSCEDGTDYCVGVAYKGTCDSGTNCPGEKPSECNEGLNFCVGVNYTGICNDECPGTKLPVCALPSTVCKDVSIASTNECSGCPSGTKLPACQPPIEIPCSTPITSTNECTGCPSGTLCTGGLFCDGSSCVAGEPRNITLLPDSDVSIEMAIAGGYLTNYEAARSSNGSVRLAASGAGGYPDVTLTDIYGLENLGETGSITNVKIEFETYVMCASNSCSYNYVGGVKIGGSNYLGNPIEDSLGLFSYGGGPWEGNWDVNPNTGLAWTIQEINDLEVILKVHTIDEDTIYGMQTDSYNYTVTVSIT